MANKTPEELSNDIDTVTEQLSQLKAETAELTEAQKTMFADYSALLETIRQAKTTQEQFLTLKQREISMMRERRD